MIRLQLTARHYDIDDKIAAYVTAKLGGLDRYLPRRCRDDLAGSVVLEFDESHTQDRQCVCEVQFHVKGERFQAKEATLNMYAAIDICEQKLKSQILSYKSKHEPARNRRRGLWSKMFSREVIAPDDVATPDSEQPPS